jgi:hypothetical protein
MRRRDEGSVEHSSRRSRGRVRDKVDGAEGVGGEGGQEGEV